ncbi:MAG: hypothetical protein IPI02_23665 [Sterolibacteriaceae bacterium]|nr:hypothetical protein [Sterolibacteriaceae bacterium]
MVFKSEKILGSLYQQLAHEAVLSVKAEQIATFPGKKITPQLAAEIGSRLSTRIEGTCIKHKFGSVSIKIYDKFVASRASRPQPMIAFFKHHRRWNTALAAPREKSRH